MGLFSGYRGNARFWLKGYLFLGVAVMILAMLFYSNHLISRMREHSQATSRLFSRYIANVLFEVSDDGALSDLREVIQESNLPIIITVLDGRPILWHRLGIEERTEEDFQTLVSMDIDNPPTEKLRRIIEMYRAFDDINDPIPIRVVGASSENGYVHYGLSPLQRELRMMPFVQLGIFLIFMAVAIQGLRYLKLSEQRFIWVGMAKETAHQLGTPLSALLGWVHLIRDRAQEKGYADIESSIDEMEVDLVRLEKVTDRFSKIGSQPDLVPVDLAAVIEHTVAYFHKRLSSRRSQSTIEAQVGEAPNVRGNEELIEWVLENLIKNGLDALGEADGRIVIRTQWEEGQRMVSVYIQDTGRGIPASQRDSVFRPGFTTKRRGWGLGLALTRRIVEEYHGGTIRVMDSRPGKGTTFLIRLPAA